MQRKFTLASNNIYSTLAYLHLAHADHSFAPSILEILVEDRRVIYAERINDNRNIISYEESDLVISHTEVDSGTEKDCVGISSYQDTEPFWSVHHIDHESYFVQRLSSPHSSKIKYIAENVYTLPPSILSCESVDGCDTRYLNYSHQLVISPLKIIWILCYKMILSFYLLLLHYWQNIIILLKHYNFLHNVPPSNFPLSLFYTKNLEHNTLHVIWINLQRLFPNVSHLWI